MCCIYYVLVLFLVFSSTVSKVKDECIGKLNTDAMKFRREEIKKEFVHAYHSYEKCCYGADEIRPISNDSRNEFGGLGATIIDNLDTMYIMGLTAIIRVVGGLLSAYDLSKEQVFLEKAKEMAGTGLPYSELNLKTGAAQNKMGTWVFLSEIATLYLEFAYLSHHTGDDKFIEKANAITKTVANMNIPHMSGLYPNMIDIETASGNPIISLGAHGDSAYEYFLKGYLLTGDLRLKRMYDESLDAIRKYLVKRSKHEKFLYIIELSNGQMVPKMDHLVCFFPGTVALGAKYNKDGEIADLEEMKFARELLDTCVHFYDSTGSGLGPEIVHFHIDHESEDYFIKEGFDSHYLLRPETVESVFYLYRLTKDEELLEVGWRIFQAIVRNCRTDVAFSGVRNVMVDGGGEHNDVMESFFLAETLKYLYLLFSEDDVISLDNYVFTTEAHPLSKFKLKRKKKEEEIEGEKNKVNVEVVVTENEEMNVVVEEKEVKEGEKKVCGVDEICVIDLEGIL